MSNYIGPKLRPDPLHTHAAIPSHGLPTAQHAPGPWSVGSFGVTQKWISAPLPKPKDPRNAHSLEVARAGSEADAAHIVRCVNQHDDLIRIAKSYLNHLEAGAVEQHESEEVDAHFIREFFARTLEII